jgi:hypothetical protein
VSLPFIPLGRRACRDLLGRRGPVQQPDQHLAAAARWLARAQDQELGGGASYGYSLRGGWRPPYRETSGYIAVSFFDLARDLRQEEFRERAIRMCHWLCEVQEPDGSIANPQYAPGRGLVFDTGQVLMGYNRGYAETNEPRFLESARRAGTWLVQAADAKGIWSTSDYLGIPHVYNSRVAGALLQLHTVAPHPDFERVARANLDWALSEERNGWLQNCSFKTGVAPFTHTIAYAIDGIQESNRILREAKYQDSVLRCATAVIGLLRADGFLPGQIDGTGQPAASYCCLTGNAQMAIIWGSLFLETGDQRFRQAAESSLSYVMSCQDLTTSDANVRGAISGSHPVWGRYSPMTYPNWAAKFFVDALLIRRKWPA